MANQTGSNFMESVTVSAPACARAEVSCGNHRARSAMSVIFGDAALAASIIIAGIILPLLRLRRISLWEENRIGSPA